MSAHAVEMEAPARILVVDDDRLIVEVVSRVLAAEGFDVISASDGQRALELVRAAAPDLVISDVDMPALDGLGLVRGMRADPDLERVPVIFLSSMSGTGNIVAGLQLGGDDYLAKPFQPAELVARVRAKLERVPVPVHLLPIDRRTGLLSELAFRAEMDREFQRFQRGGARAVLAAVSIHEVDSIRLRLGSAAADATFRQLAGAIRRELGSLDVVGRFSGDTLHVLMPETDGPRGARRLEGLVSAIAARPIDVSGRAVLVTPVVGFCTSTGAGSADEWLQRAGAAREFAGTQLTLQPVEWDERIATWADSCPEAPAPGRVRRAATAARSTLRTPLQVGATLLAGVGLPLTAYTLLDRAGMDITGVVYIIVVISLLGTGALIWAEGLLALRAPSAPSQPGEPYPPATAVIAAYLPNEAATILETLDRFLSLAYPGGLEVILAYNTPRDLPVEARLRELEEQHPRFRAFRVPDSSSKAQNVNAALELSHGRFIGVFDADHLPQADSFERAWRWLSNGYDVVQGHCMVRNGDASWLARQVAVEFEMIYSVSHPGRAAMHGFGIFGGSNGYWRTDRLHRMRMRNDMLTEDIDASMRVVIAGGRIASDPGLISEELATTTVRQLWNQRMRWAQGWFQVSVRHFWAGMRSPALTLRNKVGLVHLLLWREVYPWISMQVIPIVLFWAARGRVDWFVPIFVVTSVLTFTVGPGQAFLAYVRAAPPIRAHPAWFLGYLIFSPIYSEMKNVIVRVSQFKQLAGEREWRVTPRTSANPPAVESVAA